MTASSIPSDALMRQLRDAIAGLDGDGDYVAGVLAEFLAVEATTAAPASKPGGRLLTEDEERFLIEGASITREEYAAAAARVRRGSLSVKLAETFLKHLRETVSLDRTMNLLEWDEVKVRDAVANHRLQAVEVSGQQRFPTWQFALSHPNKLIPGLAEVIAAAEGRWGWVRLAGFMSTPQGSLVAEARQAPIAWLLAGGDVEQVREIIEASDWA